MVYMVSVCSPPSLHSYGKCTGIATILLFPLFSDNKRSAYTQTLSYGVCWKRRNQRRRETDPSRAYKIILTLTDLHTHTHIDRLRGREGEWEHNNGVGDSHSNARYVERLLSDSSVGSVCYVYLFFSFHVCTNTIYRVCVRQGTRITFTVHRLLPFNIVVFVYAVCMCVCWCACLFVYQTHTHTNSNILVLVLFLLFLSFLVLSSCCW